MDLSKRLRWLQTSSKLQLILLLLLLYVVTLSHLPLFLSLSLLFLCVGLTILFDLLSVYIRIRKLFFPYSAIITGLIVTLIIDPSASWIQIAAIPGAAMALKNFVRISGRHMFNPAASGLFVGWLLFGLNPSWWGASYYTGGELTFPNALVFFAIISLAFVSCVRMKRVYCVVSFLLVYTFLSVLLSQSINAISATLLSLGTLFFSIVMLPEPMTSPVKKPRQILYGSLVAVLTTLFVFGVPKILPLENPPDYSIVALLLGNLVFFKFR